MSFAHHGALSWDICRPVGSRRLPWVRLFSWVGSHEPLFSPVAVLGRAPRVGILGVVECLGTRLLLVSPLPCWASPGLCGSGFWVPPNSCGIGAPILEIPFWAGSPLGTVPLSPSFDRRTAGGFPGGWTRHPFILFGVGGRVLPLVVFVGTWVCWSWGLGPLPLLAALFARMSGGFPRAGLTGVSTGVVTCTLGVLVPSLLDLIFIGTLLGSLIVRLGLSCLGLSWLWWLLQLLVGRESDTLFGWCPLYGLYGLLLVVVAME